VTSVMLTPVCASATRLSGVLGASPFISCTSKRTK